MPQGSKASYTGKQKREAKHIEDSYEKRGVSKKTAEKRAWATVNKQDGGGKKSGSGKKTGTKKAVKKTVTKKTASKKSAPASAPKKEAKRKPAARGKK